MMGRGSTALVILGVLLASVSDANKQHANLWVWGANERGQLGSAGSQKKLSPTLMDTLSTTSFFQGLNVSKVSISLASTGFDSIWNCAAWRPRMSRVLLFRPLPTLSTDHTLPPSFASNHTFAIPHLRLIPHASRPTLYRRPKLHYMACG